MELTANKVFEILRTKGVTDLFHANTVLTSCAFLRRNELLSRGNMRKLALDQTEQKSDALDQKFGIYHDIFLDSVDIHDRTGKRNFYGPVLFVLNVEKLRTLNLATVWVTKSNPIKWKDSTPHNERWFSSHEDLEDNFVLGRFDQMIVLRSCGGSLTLNDCLSQVIIDDPQFTYKHLNFFNISLGALVISAKQSGSHINPNFITRKCKEGCNCVEQYKDDTSVLTKVFFPR